jgi:hypothetical protein
LLQCKVEDVTPRAQTVQAFTTRRGEGRKNCDQRREEAQTQTQGKKENRLEAGDGCGHVSAFKNVLERNSLFALLNNLIAASKEEEEEGK